jgi:hypothetical protein
VALGEVVD